MLLAINELPLLEDELFLECEVTKLGKGSSIPPAGGPLGEAREDNDGEDW